MDSACKHEILINILKDVAQKYPNVRTEILNRLSEVTREVVLIDT